MIKDATDSTKRNATYCQTLINDLNSNKHNDIVGEMVKQMGGKVAKTAETNCKHAIQWLEAQPNHRPFLFLSVDELKVCTLPLVHSPNCEVINTHPFLLPFF